MNRDEYLKILKNSLSNMSYEEVDNIIEYYSEYFEEAGVENEQKVIEELGEPEVLAQKVSSDRSMAGSYTGNVYQPHTKKRSGGVTTLIIVALVLGSPVWLSLLIAVAAIVFSVGIVVIALVFSVGITAAALVLGGVISVGAGLYGLFLNTPSGIACIGAGLVVAGVGLLMTIATAAIFKGSVKLFRFCSTKTKETMNRRRERKNNEKAY